MDWNRMKEEYGEYPEEHFEDPVDYQESIGNRHEAKRMRRKRRQVEEGETADDTD